MPETKPGEPGPPPEWPEVERRARAWIGQAGLPGATAVTRLAGDASDRRFLRVTPPDGSSRILVVHAGAIDPDTLPLVIVARLFHALPVPVPAILDADAARGIVVLEDLGDTMLETALTGASSEARNAWYREGVDLIVALQTRGARHARSDALPFRQAFDAAKLTWELQFFTAHYLGAYRRHALTPGLRQALDAEFRSLADEMAGEPRVLCHRDLHSRNLMLHGGRLHLIDFQDARMGPDTYDLASLLRDAYVDVDDRLADRCLDRYGQAMAVTDGAALRQRFERTTVQRALKALGTFGYQVTVRRNLRYAGAITRAIRHARVALARDPGRRRLRELLVPLLDGGKGEHCE